MIESAVAYDGLPISSGGAHGLGPIRARDALAAWLRFVDTCADAPAIESFFMLPETPGVTLDPKIPRAIERAFPKSGSHGRLAVPSERTDEAVSLFESLEPLPTNQWGMGPVWLCFTADFRLRSPHGGVWPGQDPALFGRFRTPAGVLLGASTTGLSLQAKRSMGLRLSIPEASDADLADLVPWLQAALPMKLSAKHWTRWTLTKDGRSYRGKRIVATT